MENLTFNELPQAVHQLFNKLNAIEKLLLNQTVEAKHEQDQWFDLIELCNYLPDKPAKATVYAWVHDSIIPCHKRSKKLAFLKSEIDAWLKEGRRKTNAEIVAEAKNFTKRKG